MIQQFLIDGIAYNVHVLSLERSFEIAEEISEQKTMSGEIYREPLGTYYHYTMKVMKKDGDRSSFDAFWEAISKPVKSHLCVFPYNQKTMMQQMYIKSGKQSISRLYRNKTEWDTLEVKFYAKKPKVMA